MKIIDEKGRLFGRINVIDFLVIIFLISFIPLLYLMRKTISKRNVPAPVVEIKEYFAQIEMSCRLIKLEPNTIKSIAVGDKELDDNGEVIGEIVWIGETRPWQYNIKIGDSEPVVKQDPKLKEIYAKLKFTTAIKESNIYYKDRQVVLDSPLYFKTGKYMAEVVPALGEGIKKVTNIAQDQVRITRKVAANLNLTFKDLSDSIARLISVGDKGLNGEGEVIAEIIDIGKIQNNIFVINLGSNSFLDLEDKNNKQVNVSVRLMADIDEKGRLYFDDKEVKNELPIKFKTHKYIVNGFVTGSLFKEKWVRVRVNFSGLIPELAVLIKEGATQRNLNGSIVGQIKNVIYIEPTKVQMLIVQNSKFVTVNNPYQKDVAVNLNLLCEERDRELFFINSPIKVGGLVTFTTDLYSISGTVASLEGVQ